MNLNEANKIKDWCLTINMTALDYGKSYTDQQIAEAQSLLGENFTGGMIGTLEEEAAQDAKWEKIRDGIRVFARAGNSLLDEQILGVFNETKS